MKSETEARLEKLDKEHEVTKQIIEALDPLSDVERSRVLAAALIMLGHKDDTLGDIVRARDE